ncbi:MAG: hypothetical protein K8F91_07645 [Candidatus Obscuribacterales bacterium]|nr:hypothetical protein [Candidatus Obscuribacterales bacterium]
MLDKNKYGDILPLIADFIGSNRLDVRGFGDISAFLINPMTSAGVKRLV